MSWHGRMPAAAAAPARERAAHRLRRAAHPRRDDNNPQEPHIGCYMCPAGQAPGNYNNQ